MHFAIDPFYSEMDVHTENNFNHLLAKKNIIYLFICGHNFETDSRMMMYIVLYTFYVF